MKFFLRLVVNQLFIALNMVLTIIEEFSFYDRLFLSLSLLLNAKIFSYAISLQSMKIT